MMKPWSPRAMNILQTHLRSFVASERDAERVRIVPIIRAICTHEGVGWVAAWMVRAAIAGKTERDTFDPNDFVEQGDLAKKDGKHATHGD